MATCKSCGAEIIWAVLPSGKRAPFDLGRVETGTHALHPDRGEHRAVLRNDAAPSERLYVSHFFTCPSAAQHRRPKSQPPAKAGKE